MKSLAELLRGIREGVKAVKEGRIRPWDEVKKELFGDEVIPQADYDKIPYDG